MGNQSELPKETGENLNPTIIKEEVSSVDGVSVFRTRINNPSEFDKFKPKNSKLDNAEWVLAVSQWGLEGTMAREFKEWRIGRPVEPQESMYFGQLTKNFKEKYPDKKINESWAEYSRYILHGIRTREFSEMGRFGEWAQEVGITDKGFLEAIAKEFLEM